MKRFLSTVCALVLMLSVMAFSASATGNSLTLAVDSQNATTTVISATLDSSDAIQAITMYYDMTAAVAAGGTVTVTPGVGSVNYNSAQKLLVIGYTNTTGDSANDISGSNVLATITVTGASSAYDITKKAESSRTKTKLTGRNPGDGSAVDLTSTLTYTSTLSVPVYGGGTPSVTTLTGVDYTLGNSGEAVHSKNPGGVESGSAFRITFDRPAGATSDDAIFGVTAGGTRKYSPRQIDVIKGLSGSITLDVSFLNGRDGSIESKTVTAVGVILANAEGTEFFYSDAEDASNKSK